MPEPTQPPPASPTADELKAQRKAEFSEWITEFTKSSGGANPAPPASSGLTLDDVAAFLDKRERERKDGDRMAGIEKSLKELGDKLAQGPSAPKKRFSLFDY